MVGNYKTLSGQKYRVADVKRPLTSIVPPTADLALGHSRRLALSAVRAMSAFHPIATDRRPETTCEPMGHQGETRSWVEASRAPLSTHASGPKRSSVV